MRHIIFISLLLNFLFSEDFISEFEYGQMLYKDPRGVSCASCHGKLGEGSFIASFIKKDGIKKEFYGPDIRDLSLDKFKKALDNGGRLMPKYYLTNKEIEAIYKYIHRVNSQDEEDNTTQEDIDIIDDNISLDENLSEDNLSDENETNLSTLFGDEDENSSIITKIFKSPDSKEK